MTKDKVDSEVGQEIIPTTMVKVDKVDKELVTGQEIIPTTMDKVDKEAPTTMDKVDKVALVTTGLLREAKEERKTTIMRESGHHREAKANGEEKMRESGHHRETKAIGEEKMRESGHLKVEKANGEEKMRERGEGSAETALVEVKDAGMEATGIKKEKESGKKEMTRTTLNWWMEKSGMDMSMAQVTVKLKNVMITDLADNANSMLLTRMKTRKMMRVMLKRETANSKATTSTMAKDVKEATL